MPDQYGPYRKFKYNFETLKKRLSDLEEEDEKRKQATNGIGDAVRSAKIEELRKAVEIMGK